MMTKPASVFLQLAGVCLLVVGASHPGSAGFLGVVIGILLLVAGGIGIRRRVRRTSKEYKQ